MTRAGGVGAPRLGRRRRDGRVGVAGGRGTTPRSTRPSACPRRRRACRRTGASRPGSCRSAGRTAPAPWRTRRTRSSIRGRGAEQLGGVGRWRRRSRKRATASAPPRRTAPARRRAIEPAELTGQVHGRLGAGRRRRRSTATTRVVATRTTATSASGARYGLGRPLSGRRRPPARRDGADASPASSGRSARPRACRRQRVEGDELLEERRRRDVARRPPRAAPRPRPSPGRARRASSGTATPVQPWSTIAFHSSASKPPPASTTARTCAGDGAVVEQLARGVAQRLLVVGELEVHRGPRRSDLTRASAYDRHRHGPDAHRRAGGVPRRVPRWLRDNLPVGVRQGCRRASTTWPRRSPFLREWQRQLAAGRLVGVTWPSEYGGRGAGPLEHYIVQEELARARAPELVGRIGINLVGPTLLAHGTAEQKRALAAAASSRADELWCQLFSEPGAGSDLAGVSTQRRARVDGGWRARPARRCGRPTRSSPTGASAWPAPTPTRPKHKGISCLVVDMRAPGVEVRPAACRSPARPSSTRCSSTTSFVPDDQRDRRRERRLAGRRPRRSPTSGARTPASSSSTPSCSRSCSASPSRRARYDDHRLQQRLAEAYVEVRLFQLHNWRSLSRLASRAASSAPRAARSSCTGAR